MVATAPLTHGPSSIDLGAAAAEIESRGPEQERQRSRLSGPAQAERSGGRLADQGPEGQLLVGGPSRAQGRPGFGGV